MISNIYIRNLKSLVDADIDLAPMSIFTGLNGMGKSSVIQALLLLRQSYKDGGFQKGLFLRSDELIQMGRGSDVFSINADKDDKLSFCLEWDKDSEKYIELNFYNDSEKDVLPFDNAVVPENFSFDSKALFNDEFQYLSADRIKPQIQYKTSPYFVDEHSFLGKTGEFTVHYLAKNQDKEIRNDKLQHPEAKSNTLIDNVDAWLSEISPGIRVKAEYHMELESATLAFRFWQGSDFTDEFKPIHVGFGLTYVLPVITAVLMSDKDAVIIVENPESHLHPAGQSKLGRLCALAAQSGVQLVVETHSDHFINGVRVGVKDKLINNDSVAMYYFQRDLNRSSHESEIIPVYIREDGSIDKWPKGFMDEWDNQLDNLLDL